MKKIYELCFRTENDEFLRNVMFSSLTKANKNLKGTYSVGSICSIDNSPIVSSFIVERVLF